MAAAGGSPALPWRAHAGIGDAKKDLKPEVQMKAFVSGQFLGSVLTTPRHNVLSK